MTSVYEGVRPPDALGGDLRVAVVHDYLTQRGGAERVVLSLLSAFPGARLVTSVYDADRTFPEFREFEVETTWLDRVPAFRNDPRRALPLLPQAFAGIELDDVDLVVCSSSGWSHGVRTSAPKLVYCHNPARWLYQRHLYVDQHGPVVRGLVRAMSPYLKKWDREAAAGVTTYLANSASVAGRVLREYGVDAHIVPPAVTIDPHARQEAVPGVEPGYLLTVSRARGYKNADVVCDAVESLPDGRLVVVGDLPLRAQSERVRAVSDVNDAQLRWLYANCAGVVGASFEDFGLTPVEGYVFGRPAACLRAGGYLDTMIEGTTGVFFDNLDVSAVASALVRLRLTPWDANLIKSHAQGFGLEAFRARMLGEAALVTQARAA